MAMIVPANSHMRDVAAELVAEYLGTIRKRVDITEVHREVDLHMSAPFHALWIAMHGTLASGCLEIHPLGSATDFEVKRLYVRSRFRRHGYGVALMRTAEAFAGLHGAQAVYLDTKSTMLAALALYEALGYERVSPYHVNPCADVFLRKRLANTRFYNSQNAGRST